MPAHVKLYNRTPTLFVDDRPIFAGYLWSAPPTPEVYPDASCARYFAEAGIHIYTFDVGSTSEWCGPGAGRSEPFDFSTVETRFGHILKIDPEARFHLRIHLEMPEWWQRLYPDECELSSEGQRMPQSFASQVWREQAKTFLRAYVAHLQTIGLAERVIAYQTGAGGTGEWVKQTAMAMPCGDYSQPMRHHFRTWLRLRYNDDVSALHEAWNDPHVTFDTAEVPPADEQLHPHALFRDPRREQHTIDYFRCLSDLCADLVIDFCRTVKEAMRGEALAGAFFGYLMELAWNSSFFGDGVESSCSAYQRSGHLGLRQVLLSPSVDFIVSPYSYGFRGIGGEGAPMPPTESVRLHGKLYIFEEDSRTHLSHHDPNYGRVNSLEESVAVLQRNIAQVVTKGLGIWWLGNTIDPAQEPAFRPLLHRFQELGTFALRLDRTPCAEVAVLLDDESFFYETARNDLDLPLIFQQRLLGLPRLGAPSDVYLLQDLIEGRLPPYKLYIFLNAFRLDQTRREALARELRRDGRVAVWLYAPGYIRDDLSTEHMTELTGFRFGIGERPWPPFMHIVNFEHPITTGLPQDLFWGTVGYLHPLFHLEDPDALVLGQVVSSQGRCKPGMGIKAFREWTSLYIAVPNVPAPVLRGIARFAGVHLYSEAGDVLYATSQFLGVHTVSGGDRIFHLPRGVDVVYDLFSRNLIARDTDRFRVVLPAASTALYYTGDADTLSVLHVDL
ncbi:MAG: beta-galactosidase [Candidatus Latescibacteria bacterium]|nr:beta-galactosidase [Candidatus Latescibacterota bacterium]